MADTVESRLSALGLNLPSPPPSVGNYVPWVVSGNLVHVSGQLPLDNGTLRYSGRLGETVSLASGQEAARLCALNLLGQLRCACGGDLGRVRRVVKLNAFIAATPDFIEHPKVANGASDLMAAAFGESGRHARAAIGAISLPLGAAVEIDGLFEID